MLSVTNALLPWMRTIRESWATEIVHLEESGLAIMGLNPTMVRRLGAMKVPDLRRGPGVPGWQGWKLQLGLEVWWV